MNFIGIKRIYEEASENDGYRILIDRIWPRGISKEDAKLDEWNKNIAPSTTLRKWFDHKEERFAAFESKYRAELKLQLSDLDKIREIAKNQKVTILYGAKNVQMNQAVVLQKNFDRIIRFKLQNSTKMKMFFSLLIFFSFSHIYAQTKVEAETNYQKLKDIIAFESDFGELKTKLDSLTLTFKDQRNNYVVYLINRSVDFGFNHHRINVQFDMWQYQIDLMTENNSIHLKSIKTEYFRKFSFENIDKNALKNYLEYRNSFYKSNKTYKDLVKEISLNETFAMNCGDGFPFTNEGIKLHRLVANGNVLKLKKMLSSFNCEKQAFAVLGFNLLIEKGIDCPIEYKKMIEHIKKRNSELQICSGCITGLIEKIY